MKDEKNKIDVLIKVFDNQQMLISNADSKANISLSIQTFVITTVLGTSIIVDTLKNILQTCCSTQRLYYTIFIIFLITSIFGLTFCIIVFRPRKPQEKNEEKRNGITYFGHISKFINSNEYLEKINETKQLDIIKEFAFQNFSLAKILVHKMKFVKYSTTLLFINITVGTILLIFTMAIK
jgi:hypothetical protein